LEATTALIASSPDRHDSNREVAIPKGRPSMADPAARGEHPPTLLESALRYDRTHAVVLLVLVPLISWIWIVVMARDMYGPTTGASAWMMTALWDVRHLLLLWAMWPS
jgi:hypothetical protein